MYESGISRKTEPIGYMRKRDLFQLVFKIVGVGKSKIYMVGWQARGPAKN